MNTPVNFTIAKLLKAKGFDEISGKLWYFNGSNCIDMTNKNSENYGFSAPTITEVVMWLYENHGIWISVHYHKSRKFSVTICNECDISLSDGLFGDLYNSPTEAYEAAIEHVLTKLI